MTYNNFGKKFNAGISFLKPGWWLVHLAAISAVYVMGHLLWR